MKRLLTGLIIAACVVTIISQGQDFLTKRAVAQAIAGPVNIYADWSSGELVYRNVATKAAILTIKDGTDGVVVAGPFSAASIDGAIGSVTPAAGTFTTLAATGAATMASTLAVTGTLTGIGTISAEQLTSTDDGTITDDLAVGGILNVTGALNTTGTLTTIGAVDVGTTATCVDLSTNGKILVGIYRYNADPNNTTATLTATGVRAGDWVVGGCQSGAANSTFKNLEAATPGTNVITLQWEVDPGAVVTHSFMVWR
jgi:hypothetical protein